MGNQVDYLIKYVYPDWFYREDKDLEVGFSSRYQNYSFRKKLLIYVIEHQIIVAAYEIDGELFYDNSEKQHPLRLPIKKIFRIEKNDPVINYYQIKEVVPNFRPDQTRSYFPITEMQYQRLEQKLLNAN